jgi:hypothetical protein
MAFPRPKPESGCQNTVIELANLQRIGMPVHHPVEFEHLT